MPSFGLFRDYCQEVGPTGFVLFDIIEQSMQPTRCQEWGDMTHYDPMVIGEALGFLAESWPEAARALVLHAIEDMTVEECAQELQVDPRTVERWLYGDKRTGRVPQGGAWDCLSTIVYVLTQAQRAELYYEALRVLNDVRRLFPTVVLDLLYEAERVSCLAEFLRFLTRIRQSSEAQYRLVWRCLLDLYDRQQQHFPAAHLTVLYAAEQASRLVPLLHFLGAARQQSVVRYDQDWGRLLRLYNSQRLEAFFAGVAQLPTDARFLTRCRTWLKELAR